MTEGALQPVSFARPTKPAPRLSVPYVRGKHSARFWTEPEIDIVRQNFEAKGAALCVTKLKEIGSPRASKGRVYQMAHKLGLSRRGVEQPPKAARIEITPAMDQIIREHWPSLEAKGAVQGFADELGIARWRLSKRALALGLVIPRLARKEPPWTPAEEALLARIPLSNPDAAARTFREHGFQRTPAALMNKAKRLHVSRRWRETLTAGVAASLLGVDGKTFTTWIATGLVKATKRATRRLPQQGGDPWSIDRADFRQFVIDHLEAIDIRKVDKFAFVDLLATGAPSPSATIEPQKAPIAIETGRYRPGLLTETLLRMFG